MDVFSTMCDIFYIFSTVSRRSQKKQTLEELGITDIDSKHKDPLMCGAYAPYIYRNMNAMEVSDRLYLLLFVTACSQLF